LQEHKTQASQDEPIQMLHGKISDSISTQMSGTQLSGDLNSILALHLDCIYASMVYKVIDAHCQNG